MYALMNVRKPARPPFAFSTRPYLDKHGREKEATITINPFGQPVTGDPFVEADADLILFLSLAEAEALTKELAKLLADAKNGKFSKTGDLLIGRQQGNTAKEA
jgi:hypothetical protein